MGRWHESVDDHRRHDVGCDIVGTLAVVEMPVGFPDLGYNETPVLIAQC